MKVEIWSDVMCPFCYLGKKQFEKALSQFSDAESVEITYRSFELNPDLSPNENRNLVSYLSETKNIEPAQVHTMFSRITEQGKQEGIDFRFDIAQVVNSRNAHKLIQLAKHQSKQSQLEEALFYAYFTLGKDVNNVQELDAIATEVGLSYPSIQEVLQDQNLEDGIIEDNYAAQQVGARGVPFFVFDNRYAISGAQGSETFLNVLETVKIKSQAAEH